jgi:hypothetical protein
VLEWARTNGCDWGEEICSVAASKGHLNILQWSCENGCPWDEKSCVYEAVCNEKLEILQWLNKKGIIKWDKRTFMAAKRRPRIMQWAMENNIGLKEPMSQKELTLFMMI